VIYFHTYVGQPRIHPKHVIFINYNIRMKCAEYG